LISRRFTSTTVTMAAVDTAAKPAALSADEIKAQFKTNPLLAVSGPLRAWM
jgi:hypothetical protein